MTSPGNDHLLQRTILACALVSTVFIVIATTLYPGGSIHDPGSVGFIWSKNFFSNLFQEKAINGAENTGRVWALIGMAIHCIGDGLFFIRMARVIAEKHTKVVLYVVGYGNIAFNFGIATSLHDVMVTISSTLSMLGLFYITVLLVRTKLHVLKVGCAVCMLLFYYTLFLYGTGDWGLLAIMQKVAAVCALLLTLVLTFFTRVEDLVVRPKA